MKSILLLDTSIGSLNQGDEIIMRSIYKNWEELFEHNYIMRMATHTPMYTTFQSMMYRKKLGVFSNADFKFLCGTNALYTNMLRPLPSWNINVFNTKMAEGTMCLGAGIGINSKKANLYTRLLYDKILNRSYVHSVRDEKTKAFLEDLGFKAENTGCPTVWGLTPEHCDSIRVNKGSKVVFTLTYYEKDFQNDRSMIDILLKNYETVYFWPQCLNDLEYLKEVTDSQRINTITPNVSSFDQILGQDDVDYVGNRLHGGIFALQHQCRTIIIGIDYRAKEVHETYSFPYVERDNIGSELEQMINSEFKTRITGVDPQKIAAWKGQFDLG